MILTMDKRAENAVMWHLHTHNNRENLSSLMDQVGRLGIPQNYIAQALNHLYKEDKVVLVYHSHTVYKVSN